MPRSSYSRDGNKGSASGDEDDLAPFYYLSGLATDEPVIAKLEGIYQRKNTYTYRKKENEDVALHYKRFEDYLGWWLCFMPESGKETFWLFGPTVDPTNCITDVEKWYRANPQYTWETKGNAPFIIAAYHRVKLTALDNYQQETDKATLCTTPADFSPTFDEGKDCFDGDNWNWDDHDDMDDPMGET